MSEVDKGRPEATYTPPDNSEYGDDVVYDKLVRDFIPEKMDEKGVDTEYEICEDNEVIIHRLIDKIIEEAGELRDASPEKVAGELVDIYEPLLSIAERSGIDFQLVLELAEDKRRKRGGYDKGIILKRATKRPESK